MVIGTYVDFSKGTRGDIGFTKDGEYIARLVPVVAGKFDGSWWLIPIRNADTVSDLGSIDGADEMVTTPKSTIVALEHLLFSTLRMGYTTIGRFGDKRDFD